MKKRTGRTEPESTIEASKKEIIEECLEPQPFWDDWNDHRDGFRGYGDPTKIRDKNMTFAEHYEVERYNKKNKKLLKRRKAMKSKRPR